MAVVLTLLVLGISSLSNISTTIAKGIFIDDVDVSGMTQEKAITAVSENAKTMLDSFEITLSYGEKQWTISAPDIGASADIESAVNEAMNVGKSGSFFEMVAERNNIKSQGLYIVSQITPDEKLLEKYLMDIKDEIDTPVTEAVIIFDPTGYDFFDETMDSSMMFDITEGIEGRELDINEAKSLVYSAILNRESSEIALPVKEIAPQYSAQEISDMQTLVCHSSSNINGIKRMDSSRNHNIQKALDFFKGMVIEPGDTISFFDIIGEPSHENGYLEDPGPLIARESVSREYFISLTQAATAIYNASFRAGAEIIEVNHHNYPAYKNDYGYGMDAYVKYGESDLVFKNTTDYPMFIDTYLKYDSKGRPGYADVDVYTVPIGKDMHIAPISEIVETIAPPPAKYEEVPENQYQWENWVFDEEMGLYIYQQKTPRDGYIVQVYKAVYENGVKESPGVWTGGEIVSKEEYEIVEYSAQQGLIYTKPADEP